MKSERLRCLNVSALPLHLGELLLGGFEETHDGDRDGRHTIVEPLERGERGQEANLFTFLDAADRLFERVAEALGRVNLSYAKYEMLTHLRAANEPVTLGALAEEQQCQGSNVTQLLDQLESEGMVRRVDDFDDEYSQAQITPPGQAQVEDGATQIDLVRAQFAAVFTAAERAELGRLLLKLTS
jgi:DNA-binding MarR family transcriptional regulator